MYINYQPQNMLFRSREKQSCLKRSVQLRSSTIITGPASCSGTQVC